MQNNQSTTQLPPQSPPPGERSALQARPAIGFSQQGGWTGFSSADPAAFAAPLPGSYATYRLISAHPTAALVRGMIAAPIVANTWQFRKTRADIPEEWLIFVAGVMNPLRQSLVRDALRALEFGWAGFEKIWTIRAGRRVLQRLKPLLWDCTDILVDAHGNVRGLRNQPAGSPPVTLTGEKYFLYTSDGEAGNPYGRSRHENIRQSWSEADQIRQRLAQYLRKVSGMIVQLHYPEGTSHDAAGAERPNQWLAQQVLDAVSAGRSVMFPNGFASTADVQTAYDLGGKSPWQLSAFDGPGADHAPGMKLILEYYDALIFRGWLRPERSGLESRFGSRADAQTHTDTGALDAELIDRDLADAVNQQIIDELLTLNFGPQAAGAIVCQPAPMQTDSLGILRSILTSLLQKGDPQLAAQLDSSALLEQLNVPQKSSDAP